MIYNTIIPDIKLECRVLCVSSTNENLDGVVLPQICKYGIVKHHLHRVPVYVAPGTARPQGSRAAKVQRGLAAPHLVQLTHQGLYLGRGKGVTRLKGGYGGCERRSTILLSRQT